MTHIPTNDSYVTLVENEITIIVLERSSNTKVVKVLRHNDYKEKIFFFRKQQNVREKTRKRHSSKKFSRRRATNTFPQHSFTRARNVRAIYTVHMKRHLLHNASMDGVTRALQRQQSRNAFCISQSTLSL